MEIKNSHRKTAVFLSALLAALLLLGSMPALAASKTTPLAVGNASVTMTWDDAWLSAPTTAYNHDLARFCLDLATVGTAKYQAMDKLRALGFTTFVQKYYDKAEDDATHTTAFTIAKKTAEVYGEEIPVFAVVLSPRVNGEFASDFNVAEKDPATNERDYTLESVYPFSESAARAAEALLPLLEGLEDFRVVVTGSSRGGASANYLARMLNDEFGPDKVFSYAFAVPNNAMQPEQSSFYYNIFSINNPEDVVTYVPLKQWGLDKYGRTLFIDAAGADFAEVSSLYASYMSSAGDMFKTFYSYGDNGVQVAAFIDELYRIAPTPQEYYETKYVAYFDNYSLLLSTHSNPVSLAPQDFFQYIIAKVFELTAGGAGTDALTDVYGEVRSISVKNLTYKPILDFALLHGVGMSSFPNISALLSIANGDTVITAREIYAAHTTQGYRAYFTSADTVDALYLNEGLLGGALDSINDASQTASLSASGAFYPDMSLAYESESTSSVESGWSQTEFSLALSVGEHALRPNGQVTVSVPLPADYQSRGDYKLYSLSADGAMTELAYTGANGKIEFSTLALGDFLLYSGEGKTELGTLAGPEPEPGQVPEVKTAALDVINVESEPKVVIVAGYDENGKMTGLYAKTLDPRTRWEGDLEFSQSTLDAALYQFTTGLIAKE